MIILKTAGEHLKVCVRERKHALHVRPDLEPGEIILLSQTEDSLQAGMKPIRYAMRFGGFRMDAGAESDRLWGKHWPVILDAESAWELATPFRMSEVQVTSKSYGPGGPLVHVDPLDEGAILKAGLLAPRIGGSADPTMTVEDPEEIGRLVVKLWNKAVGTPGYDKGEWNALWRALKHLGVMR